MSTYPCAWGMTVNENPVNAVQQHYTLLSVQTLGCIMMMPMPHKRAARVRATRHRPDQKRLAAIDPVFAHRAPALFYEFTYTSGAKAIL